jgi:poly-gamma-glutamate synthesis protein (capsule biosynthesis protein)
MRLREVFLVGLVGAALASCATPGPVALEPEPRLTIALGGDVMFGRWSGDVRRAYARTSVWKQMRAVLEPADLAVVNLESAVCPDDVPLALEERSAFIELTTPADALAALEEAGVDVASVANNHATDCGPDSVARTSAALAKVGVAAVGEAGSVVRRKVRGVEVVAIGATTFRPPLAPGRGEPGPWYVPRQDFGKVVDEVVRLRADAPEAVVLVSLHWGVEGADAPSSWQRAMARELVDAGADVVHGHGSHTVQGVEEYRGGAIAYGLGNLHFDMRRGRSRDRAVAVVRCRQGCEVELRQFGLDD